MRRGLNGRSRSRNREVGINPRKRYRSRPREIDISLAMQLRNTNYPTFDHEKIIDDFLSEYLKDISVLGELNSRYTRARSFNAYKIIGATIVNIIRYFDEKHSLDTTEEKLTLLAKYGYELFIDPQKVGTIQDKDLSYLTSNGLDVNNKTHLFAFSRLLLYYYLYTEYHEKNKDMSDFYITPTDRNKSRDLLLEIQDIDRELESLFDKHNNIHPFGAKLHVILSTHGLTRGSSRGGSRKNKKYKRRTSKKY
jgi:hypothetical protein